MRAYLRKWVERYLSDPQVLSMLFMLAIGILFVIWLGKMLIPFFAAIIIAYILEGPVSLLERMHTPRRAAVILVFTLFIIAFVLLLTGFIPLLWRQAGQLAQQFPAMFSASQNALVQLPEKYPNLISHGQLDQVFDILRVEMSKYAQHVLSFSVSSLKGLITVIVYLILVPLMVFFFLKDKDLILEWVSKIFPEERGMAKEVWHEANIQFTNYIRGKSYEIIIVWIASYILFLVLDLDFAILLSLFVGLSVLIPYVGAIFMFFPVTLVAVFQWGMDIEIVYTMISYIILQMLDGYLLAPLLLSEVVNIHPIAIIFSILLFGGLWGFWGLLFAIPLATLLHAFMKAWIERLKQGAAE